MPLEPALHYQNEADFTSRFLGPLLRRLGYSIVAEYHGQREFGKDLVFGEIDRFGEVSYHGLQSKYQDSIGQSDSEKLIDDCRQAFRNPFRHPNTGAEQRISSFVVANAGSIGDNARDNFFAAARNDEHGGNVRMFDGKALLGLDRWATIKRVEDVGEVLSGLLIELRFNHRLLHSFTTAIGRLVEKPGDPALIVPVERLRLGAVSHYIQRPVLPSQIDVGTVGDYLFNVECINGFLDAISVSDRKDHKVRMSVTVLSVLPAAIRLGDTLDTSVDASLADLGPLAAI